MFKSIKTKLIVINSIVILILLTSSIFLLYNYSKNILKDSILDSAKQGALYNAKVVSLWMSRIITEVDTLASTNSIKSMNWSLQKNELINIADKWDYIESILVADKDGNYQITSGNKSSIADRVYFQKAKKELITVVSEPLISKANDARIIAVAAPIIDNNNFQGVIAFTIRLTYLQELVNEMKLNGYGYGWIINDNKVTIAHPVQEYLGNQDILNDGNQQFRNIAERMLKGELATAEYQLNGQHKLIAFAPIDLNGWSVAMGANTSDVLAPLNIIKHSGIIIGLIAIIIGIFITYFVSKQMSNTIITASKFAEVLASGDLKQELPERELAQKDELGLLCKSLNKMSKNLKNIITQISNTANQVLSSSEELSASGEEVGKAAEQVGTAIQNVASGAEEQSAQVDETQENIKTVSQQITDINHNSKTMITSADNVMDNINKGNESVRESIAKINSVKKYSEEVSTVIKNLGNTSAEIGDIIDLINGIAEQTNLLALNAAIEAARAGEAGRGFSVVADEIRALAEESSDATNKIARLIKEVKTGVNEAVDKMGQSVESVNSSVHTIQINGTIFTAIDKEARTLLDIINTVSKASYKMDEDSNSVQSNINEISKVSQEAAANSEEVAASSQEQIAATEDIISAASQLAKMAEDLTKIIDSFKL